MSKRRREDEIEDDKSFNHPNKKRRSNQSEEKYERHDNERQHNNERDDNGGRNRGGRGRGRGGRDRGRGRGRGRDRGRGGRGRGRDRDGDGDRRERRGGRRDQREQNERYDDVEKEEEDMEINEEMLDEGVIQDTAHRLRKSRMRVMEKEKEREIGLDGDSDDDFIKAGEADPEDVISRSTLEEFGVRLEPFNMNEEVRRSEIDTTSGDYRRRHERPEDASHSEEDEPWLVEHDERIKKKSRLCRRNEKG